MNEKIILSTIESTKDSMGRIKYSKIEDEIIRWIRSNYTNSEFLIDKELISSWYRGHRIVQKCLNDNCNNFKKWDNNALIFRNYCCTKCSNSDPKKDETTVKNNMKRYGVPRASMTESSKQKLLETNLERFGCVSSAQHQSVKDKALKTNLEKYGYVSTSVGNIVNLEEYNNKEYILNNFIKDEAFLLYEFMEYFNCGQVAAHNTLNRLGIDYSKFKSKGNTGIERKIEKFLIENNIKFIAKFRDGLELDFFLPDFNIGIECDGLYYHSYGIFSFGKNKKYFKDKHINKQKLFKEKQNIDVIFIWENEINNQIKFDIWCSMLKHKILKNSIKIFARKVKIRSIPNNVAKNFLEENHIQGNTVSKYAYGLYDNEELVALMSFAQSDKNPNYEFELKRFCVKKGYSVIGGASKLLKHFEKTIKPKSLITYLNKRWSFENNFYCTLGFKYSNFSIPAKFIISGDKVFNRIQFQKHKLKDIQNFSFDETITADQNIINNGYRLIWDCGNEVYIKEYK